MLRPVSLSRYLLVMGDRGLQAQALIAGTAIELSRLEDPDYLIAEHDFLRFLENMLVQSGDAGLGLELGLTTEAPRFGVLAYAGMACRSIRQGIELVWDRYGRSFGVAPHLSIVSEQGDTATVEMRAPLGSEPVQRFSVEEALCVLLRIGSAISGEPTPFLAIDCAYPEPAYGQRYAAVFACPVRFGCANTSFKLSKSWMDRPLKTSDSELHRVCSAYLDRVLKQSDEAGTMVQRLRSCLSEQGGAATSLAEAAQALGMSSRTLARKLQLEGYSYRKLVDEWRQDMAKCWLTGTSLSPKEIGYRLGFADVTSFRRAFREWTGCTVGQYSLNPSASKADSAKASVHR